MVGRWEEGGGLALNVLELSTVTGKTSPRESFLYQEEMIVELVTWMLLLH